MANSCISGISDKVAGFLIHLLHSLVIMGNGAKEALVLQAKVLLKISPETLKCLDDFHVWEEVFS
ncbi:unnamed protein product [Enterobius vermicularis]|uniref:NR LBD domain-containing protein n=1 Tax=Enterobius vermicularis TaxID=51028 RepID=A0A0N4VLB4_ENTVE|nr:unnamed protein product [Enterobius vermicularis]